MKSTKTFLIIATLVLAACSTGATDQVDPSLNLNPADPGGAQASTPAQPSTTLHEEDAPNLSPGDAPVPLEDLVTLQTPVPEAAMPLVDIAIQDLAQRLGIALDEIEVVHYEEVVWPDASLGCPQPGMDYAQVITPGYQIVLTSDEDDFNYHADKTGIILLCEKPPDIKFPTLPPPKDADDRNPFQPIDPMPTVIMK